MWATFVFVRSLKNITNKLKKKGVEVENEVTVRKNQNVIPMAFETLTGVGVETLTPLVIETLIVRPQNQTGTGRGTKIENGRVEAEAEVKVEAEVGVVIGGTGTGIETEKEKETMIIGREISNTTESTEIGIVNRETTGTCLSRMKMLIPVRRKRMVKKIGTNDPALLCLLFSFIPILIFPTKQGQLSNLEKILDFC